MRAIDILLKPSDKKVFQIFGRIFQNGKPSWSVAVGGQRVTPHIVLGAGQGPRFHLLIGFAPGAAIYYANLGGFSMTRGEAYAAYGSFSWTICIVTPKTNGRSLFVTLPLYDI